MATTTKASADARKAEATQKREPVTFEHLGFEYTVSPENTDNLELFEAVEDEKYLTAVRGFLGNEQWALFKDNNRTEDGRVPLASLEGLLENLMEAIGQGN